jgi:hypothetical protein
MRSNGRQGGPGPPGRSASSVTWSRSFTILWPAPRAADITTTLRAAGTPAPSRPGPRGGCTGGGSTGCWPPARWGCGSPRTARILAGSCGWSPLPLRTFRRRHCRRPRRSRRPGAACDRAVSHQTSSGRHHSAAISAPTNGHQACREDALVGSSPPNHPLRRFPCHGYEVTTLAVRAPDAGTGDNPPLA